jgi:hypothetical protein
MNILQRKMFAQGDEVLGTRSSGSYLMPKAITTSLRKEGEDFFAIQEDAQGNVISKDFIDVNLSPTKDPREAYKRQKTNEALGTVSKIGAGISLLPFAQTKIGGRVVSGIGNLLTKGLGYAPKLSPITATKLPGVAIKGQKGFQPLNPLNPMSYKYGVNPVPASVVAGGSLYAGASALQTSEEDVQREIEELQAQSGTKKQETKDKAAPDPYMGGISDEEVDAVIGADTDAVTEAMRKAEYDAEYIQSVADYDLDFQDRYMDNKNMDRFLRNIGKGLVEKGRFTGIATGAVAAADERAAERILEEERQAEIDLLAAKEGGVDITDLGKIDTLEQEYLQFNQTAENNQKNADDVGGILSVMKTQGKSIFGVGNIVSSNINKIMGYISGDPSLAADAAGIQQRLQTENPREYIKTVLEIMKNREIRELLGESGRTISNLDRQIVDGIIGQLQDTKFLSQNPSSIATKLELLQEDQLKKARQNRELANAKANNLRIAGRDVRNLSIATASAPESRIRLSI